MLANQIDWAVFDTKFGRLYADKGRPALPTRLMVGLHYLKHAFNESDESVVARLLENGYWMYFCGFEFFIHRLPLDPSSLVRWRKRIGPKQMEQLLAETLEAAKREEHLAEQHMERVNVDTTVQEKAIAYPTDARLQHKARVLLVKAAKQRGITLRQRYMRLGKRALIMSGRYSNARQMRRSRAEQKKVKNYLGRVYRNILRNCPQPDVQLAELLHRLEQARVAAERCGGQHSKRTGQHRRHVGQHVTEQVVGNNNIELLGLADQLHATGIGQHVRQFYVFIAALVGLGDNLVPQHAGFHHIAFFH